MNSNRKGYAARFKLVRIRESRVVAFGVRSVSVALQGVNEGSGESADECATRVADLYRVYEKWKSVRCGVRRAAACIRKLPRN